MRLMKLRRIYLYFVSAAFILLAGCESDYENRYPFDNAAYIDAAETSSDNNVTFKKTVTQLDRELSAVLISPAKENIEVTFAIDPSLVNTYNAKHDTKYAVLDDSYYEFPERTATVEAGKSVSEPLTIHFKNLDRLDIDATQLLPVTIVSAGGGSFDPLRFPNRLLSCAPFFGHHDRRRTHRQLDRRTRVRQSRNCRLRKWTDSRNL